MYGGARCPHMQGAYSYMQFLKTIGGEMIWKSGGGYLTISNVLMRSEDGKLMRMINEVI